METGVAVLQVDQCSLLLAEERENLFVGSCEKEREWYVGVCEKEWMLCVGEKEERGLCAHVWVCGQERACVFVLSVLERLDSVVSVLERLDWVVCVAEKCVKW